MAFTVQTYANLQDLLLGIEAFEVEFKVKFVGGSATKAFGSSEWKDKLQKKQVLWDNSLFRLAGVPCFDGVPFIVIGWKKLECRYGPDRHSKKKDVYKQEASNIHRKSYNKKKESSKKSCPARITVQEILKFPKFAITTNTKNARSVASSNLRKALSERIDSITVERSFVASFPPSSRHQNHPCGNVNELPANKNVRDKIIELVGAGMYHASDIKRQLAFYVKQELFAGQTPPPMTDSRYWPSSKTILGYVYRLRQKAKSEAVQTTASIENMMLDNSARWLQIDWREVDSTMKSLQYPYLWLRDSCCCDACFDMSTQTPKWTFDKLDVDCEPVCAELSHLDGEIVDDVISITWNDGHLTVFTGSTLRQCQFRDNLVPRPPEHQLWGNEMQERVPRFLFKKLLTDNKTLYDWITTLWVSGLCLVTQAPKEPGQIQAIAERVAFLRQTDLGFTYDVPSSRLHDMSDATAVGETAAEGMQTDLAFNNSVPGMQMLHCVAQSKPAASVHQFTDGFLAAHQLRIRFPEYFQLLSTIPVDYYDVGIDQAPVFKRSTHQTIKVNELGEVVGVTFSNNSRDRLQMSTRLKLDQVEQFYRALRTFYGLLYSPDNLVELSLAEGDIVCFHNHRVLRAKAEPTSLLVCEQHLVGGFMDWDELLSKRRVLRRQLNVVDGSMDF